MGMKCPRYDELYAQGLKSKEVQDMEMANKVDFILLIINFI